MDIYTAWATRKDFESDAPELLIAWDEYTVDCNPGGFEEALEREVNAMGDELAELRRITIKVPQEALLAAFKQASIEAEVAG